MKRSFRAVSVAVAASLCIGTAFGGSTTPTGTHGTSGSHGTVAPHRSTNTHGTAQPSKTVQTPPPLKPVDADPAVAAASSNVETARQNLEKAAKEYLATIERVTKAYESGDEMTAAQQALKDAAAKLEAAKSPVVEKVKATADFQKTAADEESARTKLSQLRSDSASDAAIRAAADEVFALGNVNSKRIADACAADAAVAAAQKDYNAALVKVGKLRTDFKNSLDANTEVAAAKTSRDGAQKELKDAQSKLASAKGSH